ncbi:MAG: hypothetical protein WCR02_08755 [Sphaerochaetaceae bacterium]
MDNLSNEKLKKIRSLLLENLNDGSGCYPDSNAFDIDVLVAIGHLSFGLLTSSGGSIP